MPERLAKAIERYSKSLLGVLSANSNLFLAEVRVKKARAERQASKDDLAKIERELTEGIVTSGLIPSDSVLGKRTVVLTEEL